jgi:hypothetical protein
METTEQARREAFALSVTIGRARPVRFRFDQDRVLVGRGRSADLRIEHCAMSREQFVLERRRGSAGEARFRITPLGVTNPTQVNGQPAQEEAVFIGDSVRVGEVAIRIEADKEQRRADGKKAGTSLSPRTLILAVATLAMVGWVCFGGDSDTTAEGLGKSQVVLFPERTPPKCRDATECQHRAREAYQQGKGLLSQADVAPGSHYRATLELENATRYREQSGLPMPELADASALAQKARKMAESEFQDARFRLERAMANQQTEKCAIEAELLSKLVPDERHPFRVRLDAYRRTLVVKKRDDG